MVRLRLDDLEVDVEGIPTGRYGRPRLLPIAAQVHAEGLTTGHRSENSTHRVGCGIGLHPATPTAPGLGKDQRRVPSREKVLYELDDPRDVLSASAPDNRNMVLFPERIGGRYVMLHRPTGWVGEAYRTEGPAIWLAFSESSVLSVSA